MSNGAGPSGARVRVLICDDYAPLRELLRTIIDEQPGLAVVGEAADGHEAIAEAERLQPDVILLDLAMPRASGLQALQEIGRIAPRARIIIFSGFSFASLGDDVLKLGAVSYLQKGATSEAILTAIEAAAAGVTSVTSTLAR